MLDLAALSNATYLVITLVTLIFASFTAPIILDMRAESRRRSDREAQWKHQEDREARQKAERVADLAAQKEVADRLVASNDEVAAAASVSAAKTDGQLKVIHGLVNSTLTASKEGELTASELALTVTDDNIALRKKNGEEPSLAVLAARDALAARAAELRAEVADRHQKGLVAEAQIRADPTNPQATPPPEVPNKE